MFQNIRQGSSFYILDNGEHPSLKIGTVLSVSTPMPKYNTQYSVPGMEMVVDIQVQVDEEKIDFKQISAQLTIANFGTGGLVISEDKIAMLAEVESFQRASSKILDSVPYHEEVVSSGGEMLTILNPQMAKDRATEDRISALEERLSTLNTQMGDTNQSIGKMMSMLSDVLEPKCKTKKAE